MPTLPNSSFGNSPPPQQPPQHHGHHPSTFTHPSSPGDGTRGWSPVPGSLCFCSPEVAENTPVCGQRWGTVAAQEVGAFGEEACSPPMGFAQGRQEPWLPPPSCWKAKFPASS